MSLAYLVAAALTLWAPGHERSLCPVGVTVSHVQTVAHGQVAWDPATGSEDLSRVLAFAPVARGFCELTIVDRNFGRLTAQDQCTTVVHELGHSVMGLAHTRGGIMDPVLISNYAPCRRIVANEPMARWRMRMRAYERAHRRHLRRSGAKA